MTKIEQLEDRLATIRYNINYLEQSLTVYRDRETILVMELNRARREAKELQDGR